MSVSSTVAYGNVRDTRFDGTNQAYIYCRLTGYGTRDTIFVSCYAQDPQGDYLGCYLYNPGEGTISAINSIGPASRISFQVLPNTSECSSVTVYNGSQYL